MFWTRLQIPGEARELKPLKKRVELVKLECGRGSAYSQREWERELAFQERRLSLQDADAESAECLEPI